jgi:hypothetical protein
MTMADTKPMPVPGDHEAAEAEGARGGAGRTPGGESGGGAYPNPHTGKDGAGDEGFMGHGGQTDIDYHGPGQLGEKTVDPGHDENSATKRE